MKEERTHHRKRGKRRRKSGRRLLIALACNLVILILLGLVLYAGVHIGKKLLHRTPVSAERESIETAAETGSETGSDSDIRETAETEAETVREPIVQTLTLTAVGDCALGVTQLQDYDGSFDEAYDDSGESYFFENVRSIFSADDLTLVNLECTMTESTEKRDKEFNIRSKPQYAGILTSGSVEAVTLGNNHTRDYGDAGLEDTKRCMDEADIEWAYRDQTGIYTTPEGIKVGIVSVMIVPYTEEDEQLLVDGVKKLREENCNLVVACCHWGAEKEYYAVDYQVSVAHHLIDAGADLVIGHHPHVLEGIEVYQGKVICYSLGNFCFGGNRYPFDMNSMIYQQTFTFKDGELQADLDAQIHPCRISSAEDYNNYQPTISEGEQRQSIIASVNAYSEPYSSTRVGEDGKILSGN